MANEESLSKGMEEAWVTSNILKSSYPSTYLIDFKKELALFIKLSKLEESVREVIDDIVDAVIGLRPKISYFPGLTAKIFHHTFGLLPATVIDYLFFLVAPPVRQGERNRLLDLLYNSLK